MVCRRPGLSRMLSVQMPASRKSGWTSIESRSDDACSMDRAWSLAKRYLRTGTRSAQELRAYLRGREVPEPQVEPVVSRCARAGALNDRICAKLWATALADRGYAIQAIRDRLLAKGLSEAFATAALRSAGLGSDLARANAALRSRPRRSAASPAQAKRRAAGWLARRGFDQDVIEQALAGFDGPREHNAEESRSA